MARYFRNEDVDIHIIVTNESATVTGVEDDVPTISGASYVITDEDMIEEQFEIKESICSQSRPTIGCCESNSLEFQMAIKDDDGTVQTIPSRDDMIKVYMWFDDDSSNIMTIGTYKVKTVSVQNDENKATIKAYDLILTFRNTDVSDWYYSYWENRETETIKNFTDALLTELGVTRYGSLINQSVHIKQFIDGADVISAGYLLSLICEANGSFGHMGRDNRFNVIRISASQTNSVTITEDTRFNPTKRSKYEYTWSPTGVKLLDASGNKIAGYRATKEKPYSIKSNPLLESVPEDEIKGALKEIYKAMELWGYAPAKVKSIGDLQVEVGDRIRVNEEAEDDDTQDGFFKTFVLERTYKGIYVPYDTYVAKGENDLTQTDSTTVTSNFSGGSIEYNPSSSNTGKYNIINSGLAFEDLPEIIRNFGLRLLDEPSNVSVTPSNNSVTIKWNDPTDITDNSPCPCEWAGTVVVRKLGKAPINRWDGTLVVNSTTRNQYAENGYVDSVSVDKDYYYGVFPYDTEGHYRYTYSVAINTDYTGTYPTIDSFTVDSNYNAVMGITLPSGTWSAMKMVYNSDHIPNSITDGTSVDLTSGQTSVSISGLSGDYYFIIFMVDSYSREITSNEMSGNIPQNPNYYVLDSSSGLVRNVISEFVTYTDYGDAYVIDSNNRLTTNIVGGNTRYCSTIGVKKGNARKMYVEIEGTGALSQSALYILLGKTMATQLNAWEVYKSVTLVNSANTNYARQVVEVDISDIDSEFYIAFHKADIKPTIYKIYFDGQAKALDNYVMEISGTAPSGSSFVSDSAIHKNSNYIYEANNYSMNTMFMMKTYSDFSNYDSVKIAQRDSICTPSILSDGKFKVTTNNSWDRLFHLYRKSTSNDSNTKLELVGNYNISSNETQSFTPTKNKLYLLKSFNNGISSMCWLSINDENWHTIKYDIIANSNGVVASISGNDFVLTNNNSNTLNAKLYVLNY